MTDSLHATSSDTFGDHIVILPNIWKNKTKKDNIISLTYEGSTISSSTMNVSDTSISDRLLEIKE